MHLPISHLDIDQQRYVLKEIDSHSQSSVRQREPEMKPCDSGLPKVAVSVCTDRQ